MNQERFDELAKGLATKSFSRRQVLKSLAAGVLLAGPLGSLVQKAGFAQTLGCVSTMCVKRAEKEYKKCNHDCRTATNSAECLDGCKGIYAGQLGACGCVTINTDTASGDVTYAPCADPCTLQTLSEQAHQDPHYSTLADLLTTVGFAADDGPLPVVSREDGQLVRSMLVSTYFHPTLPNEVATLSYVVESSGETLVFASVQDKQEETLLYLLVVDEAGDVQKVIPPEDSQQTSMPNTVSRAAAASSCNSTRLGECLKAAQEFSLRCTAIGGFVVCPLSPPACLPFSIVCKALNVGMMIDCSERHGGCGALNTTFCTNNVCCPLGETGCGGAACCKKCEACEAGACVNLCVNGQSCCHGPLSSGVECCSPCEDCIINALSQEGQCSNLDDEGVPCGDACCGACQVCEAPFTSIPCRECDPTSPRCETCEQVPDPVGGGTSFTCVPKTCEAPLVPNSNCDCACTSGTSAFSIQSGEPVLGAISAQAALTAVVCCEEGLEPCGDSGECCAPGECDESTGQCTTSCAEGETHCGQDSNGTPICCGHCDMCPPFPGAGCIPPDPCGFRKTRDLADCECKCPPREGECEAPKFYHEQACECVCPPHQVCNEPRTEYNSETCECDCPQEPVPFRPGFPYFDYQVGRTGTQPCGDNECCVPCNGSVCAPDQVCCGHGGASIYIPNPQGEVCCDITDCCEKQMRFGLPALCCEPTQVCHERGCLT